MAAINNVRSITFKASASDDITITNLSLIQKPLHHTKLRDARNGPFPCKHAPR